MRLCRADQPVAEIGARAAQRRNLQVLAVGAGGIAIACLLAIGWQDGWLRGEQTAIALMWLLPAVEYLNPWLQGPQIGPVVTLFALLVLLRRAGPEAQNASRGGT